MLNLLSGAIAIVDAKVRIAFANDSVRGLFEYDPDKLVDPLGLSHALETAIEKSGPSGLLFLDLEKFTPFNDTYGHKVGDQRCRLSRNDRGRRSGRGIWPRAWVNGASMDTRVYLYPIPANFCKGSLTLVKP